MFTFTPLMLPNQQCQSSERMVLILSTNIISENAGIMSQFGSFSHNQQFEHEVKKKCEESEVNTVYWGLHCVCGGATSECHHVVNSNIWFNCVRKWNCNKLNLKSNNIFTLACFADCCKSVSVTMRGQWSHPLTYSYQIWHDKQSCWGDGS